MVTLTILRKGFVRQFVEQLVEFHPDMTEKQREESIQACLNVIALLAGSMVTFAGIVAWIVS